MPVSEDRTYRLAGSGSTNLQEHATLTLGNLASVGKLSGVTGVSRDNCPNGHSMALMSQPTRQDSLASSDWLTDHKRANGHTTPDLGKGREGEGGGRGGEVL